MGTYCFPFWLEILLFYFVKVFLINLHTLETLSNDMVLLFKSTYLLYNVIVRKKENYEDNVY